MVDRHPCILRCNFQASWIFLCAYFYFANARSLNSQISPFTANIYFPAVPVISRDFHKGVELINLTVTMYMVMQGLCTSLPLNPVLSYTLPVVLGLNDLAPMFWGTLSDRWGRRPITFACLVTLSLSSVGLALVPTSTYWLLMLLRCLQATGSASTIALGNLLSQRKID